MYVVNDLVVRYEWCASHRGQASVSSISVIRRFWCLPGFFRSAKRRITATVKSRKVATVVGAITEQMLEPRPAFAECVQDQLSASGIRQIGRGEVDHQQSPVGAHRDVAFTSGDLLASIVAALRSLGRLHRLAIQDRAGQRASAS